jgi:hypothetical protein
MQLLVGGEPARLLLDTIRGFSLSVSGGRVRVHQAASPAALAAVARAYEIVELEVIIDATHCSEAHEHKTLDEQEFRHIVLSEIVWQAKVRLGETQVLDPIWECRI